MTREELISQAENKWEREDLIRRAEEKWARGQKSETPVINKVETAARSFLEGPTVGLSEPIISGANALIGGALDQSDSPYFDKVKKAYGEDVARRKGLERANPDIAIGSEVLGTLAPSPLNIASKIFKGADKAAHAIKILEGKGLLKSAARGALSGAVGGAEFEAARQVSERPTGFIDSDSAIGDVGHAAMFGGGIGGGVSGVVALPGAIARGSKKLLSAKGGVTEDSINKYLVNHKEINAAPTMEELHDKIDKAVRTIYDDAQSAQVGADTAENALQQVKQMTALRLKEAKLDARDALAEADRLVKASVERAKISVANELPNAVNALKEMVTKGSSDAFDILAKSGGKMKTSVLKGAITRAKNELGIGGKTVGQADDAAVQSLDRLRTQLDDLPTDLSMDELKKIVQSLDRDIGYTGGGQFMDPASRHKLTIRRSVDKTLKGRYPKYGEAMAPVAEDTRLLGEASEAFGDRTHALSNLSSIDKMTKTPVKESLDRLGRRVGRDFVTPILEESVTDFPRLQNARMVVDEMNRPGWADEALSAKVAATPEAATAEAAKKRLEAAQAKLQPFKPLAPNSADQTSIQSKIKALMRGHIETKEMFEKLSKLTGDDFVKTVENLRLKEAFQKGDRAGSSNPVTWAGIIGGFAGLAGGLPGAAAGVPVGVAIGKVMDRFGPQIAKSLLDGVIKIRGIPTVSAIMKLRIPEELKSEMVKNYTAYMSSGKHIPNQVRQPAERD